MVKIRLLLQVLEIAILQENICSVHNVILRWYPLVTLW